MAANGTAMKILNAVMSRFPRRIDLDGGPIFRGPIFKGLPFPKHPGRNGFP